MKSRVVLVALTLAACGPSEEPPIQDGEPFVNNSANNVSNAPSNGPNNDGNTPNNGPNNGPNNESNAPNNVSNTPNNLADCVPDQEAFQVNALPFIQQYCANCHGQTPAFGAPMTLLDYDSLIAGTAGERIVDKMTERLVAKTMPPAGSPAPLHVALDTMVEWSSCGTQHADHTVGLEASRPLWEAPDDPPAGLEFFDVVADDYPVSPTTLDRYQCFVIEAPIDEPRLIRRFDPVIDDGRVLHHSLVKIDTDRSDVGQNFSCYGFPPGDDYAYVWGPGQPSIQFPDGGLRIEPGTSFVLQIHYNNGAGAEDVRDSSGFRVWHEPVGGAEYGLFEVGALIFPPIADGEEASANHACTVREDTTLVASWPHMHEIGSEFITVVERQNGSVESIIELSGWQFEAQLIYDTPIELRAGDVLRTTCSWVNNTGSTVVPGLGTSDEMCFNFMYVTPNVPTFCN